MQTHPLRPHPLSYLSSIHPLRIKHPHNIGQRRPRRLGWLDRFLLNLLRPALRAYDAERLEMEFHLEKEISVLKRRLDTYRAAFPSRCEGSN